MNERAKETPENGTETPKRKRTGRKRTNFQIPRQPAVAVRDLWRSASEAEQVEAHRRCVLMIEHWLGKRTKKSVAEELGVTPLRVWQMSQQAVSGMMAGLLKQPRSRRGRPPLAERTPENDPVELRKRIIRLERDLRCTEDLVRVLRTAPWVQRPEEGKPAKGRKRAAAKRNTGTGKATRRPRDQAPHRSRDPKPPAHEGRAGGDGSDCRTDGADTP